MKVHYAVGKYIIAIFILLLLVITTLLFFTSHIQDFDYENKDQEELSFVSQGNRLSGTLLTPQHKTPSAVIVVIHGDGPQDRYSNGGYIMIFNHNNNIDGFILWLSLVLLSCTLLRFIINLFE